MYKNEINLLKQEELRYNLLKQQKINAYIQEKNVEKMNARDHKVYSLK